MRNWVLFTIFMTAVLVSSAGVAIVPDIAKLAGPIVCSDGSLVTDTHSYTRGPGTSGKRTSAACIGPDGKASPLNAGLVMLVITVELFLPLALIGMGWLVYRERWKPPVDD